MVSVAIVEDDRAYTEILKGYLVRYQQERHTAFQITYFENGAEFLDHKAPMFDVIFMDIEMPVMNGMDAAVALRKTDPLAVLIFITHLAQYAIKGYEVNALDYIVKPIQYSHFSIKMDKALRSLPQKESWYTLSTDNGVVRLDLTQIRYVESQKHTALFYTSEGIYTARATLKSVEAALESHGFARPNNSFLLNLRYVRSVHKNQVFAFGQTFSIGRSRRKTFLDAFAAYLGGGVV